MSRLFRLAVTSVHVKGPVEGCVGAIEEAARRGADLVLLPEEPDVVGGGETGRHGLEDHPAYLALSEAAAKRRIGVVGSLSVRLSAPQADLFHRDQTGVANLGFLLNRRANLVGTYWKKHPAPSEEFIATDQCDADGRPDPFPVFDFEGVKLGIAICMDIHFPEMFRIYGLKGADLVCMPTMYLDYTGDMLEAVEKARAVDNGMYLALSRYIDLPFLSGKSMGYAKVVAPDGRVIVSTGHKPGVAVAEFDPKWRFPFWGEGYGGNLRTMFEMVRRPDLYGELLRRGKEG